MVLDLAPDGEHVRGIYAVFSPDKLSHLHPTTDHSTPRRTS